MWSFCHNIEKEVGLFRRRNPLLLVDGREFAGAFMVLPVGMEQIVDALAEPCLDAQVE